jgi:type IV pilus assembly protein PilN
MIKINLLPTKKKPPRKVSDLQKQLIVGGVVLILAFAAMGAGYIYLSDTITALKQQKTTAETRLRDQDNMLKEVKNVESERDRVKEKINVVEQLKKNQAGPVRLLDELSKALPLGVNITSMTESNKSVSIEGQAFGNHEVVRFIDNLKASPFLTGVNLLETSQAKAEGIDIYKYKLQFVYKGL